MNKYTAAVLAAGSLWGFMGLFTRSLSAMGVGPSGAIFIRCSLSAVFFALSMLASDKSRFRVRLRDVWCFVGSGVCALLFFTYCYFRAIELMSLSAAAILLYTAPSIVMLLSLPLFREKLTGRKLLALALAFAGCCLVSGVGTGQRLTTAGILFGLGSGLGYALYSIFARLAMNRGYSGDTVNFYSCALTAVGAALIWGAKDAVSAGCASWGSAAFCLCAALVTCFLPYKLYTFGMSGMETGRASVIASVEPVVATLVGAVVYSERLSMQSLAGVIAVLSAVVLLNLTGKRAGAARK